MAKMMPPQATKYWLVSREWYPIATIIDFPASFRDVATEPANFTAAEIADLRRVQEEFKSWQERLAQRFGQEESWGEDHLELIDTGASYAG